MEHYYVICGNAFGFDLDTKVNFFNLETAKWHFNNLALKDIENVAALVYVNPEGIEKDLDYIFKDQEED